MMHVRWIAMLFACLPLAANAAELNAVGAGVDLNVEGKKVVVYSMNLNDFPYAGIVGEKTPEADLVITPWPSDHRASMAVVELK